MISCAGSVEDRRISESTEYPLEHIGVITVSVSSDKLTAISGYSLSVTCVSKQGRQWSLHCHESHTY